MELKISKNRILEISDDLDLNPFINKKTGELSSGQKNRVSLAKSLINKPKILFLDEPTASLDPDIGDFVREYIEKYKSKNKVSILLASHNMKEVERLCDQVIMMKNGSVVDSGTCNSLIKKHGRNNLEDTFLKIARKKMNWYKIYGLSLRHFYLIKSSFPRILRFNLLAKYSDLSLGLYIKVFYFEFIIL